MRRVRIFFVFFCFSILAAACFSKEMDLRKGGTLWAKIEPDGWIRIEGSLVGRFEPDGTVRKDGSLVGKIEEDGYIRRDGSLIGRIEPDGTLRRNGSIIGQIESDGTIRRDGSIWGSAGNCCADFETKRAVTAVLVFFTSDFFGQEDSP